MNLRCWLKVDQNQIIFSMIQQIWRQMKKNVFTVTSWSRVPLTIRRNVSDYLDILDHGKSQSIEKINIRQNVRCRRQVPCLLRLKYECPFSNFYWFGNLKKLCFTLLFPVMKMKISFSIKQIFRYFSIKNVMVLRYI